ncbi:unnamed protein product [Lasius platythorax]|uniref:Chemotaxis protein histidine kinase-like kinase protein n=2 Tax=Lasius TaxID=488720 RepID=A0A0J7KW92_LASNI|nr:chemotaxis protein histidine kinase-like kinase protein [Lasius niger]
MKRDDYNADYRVEDLQSLSENGKAMRTSAVEGWKGDRGLKTISLAPYLTPACIRGWEYPLLSRWEKETAGDEPLHEYIDIPLDGPPSSPSVPAFSPPPFASSPCYPPLVATRLFKESS